MEPSISDSVLTNPGSTGNSITVTLSAHSANNVLLIWLPKTGNAAWTVPSPWINIGQATVGTATNGLHGSLFARRVLPTDSLPLPDPLCTLNATVTRFAACLTIDNADIESIFVLSNYGARSLTTGTANPIRPGSVTTPAPEMLAIHFYAARLATNAPDPSGYTQDEEAIASGTLVMNVSHKVVADQTTALTNQDASPTSGGRWVGGIVCIPSLDYPYYRSGSQATATGTAVTPNLPAGTTATDQRGNKDVLQAIVEAAGAEPSAPAGWTEVFSGTTSGGATTVKKFYAYMSGTLSRTFTRPTSGEISACLTTYYNCHQTNPIGAFNTRQNASSTTSAWDALNRTNSQIVMQAACVADGTQSFTSPTGWVEQMDGLGITCSHQIFKVADVTGSDSFTLSTGSPTLVSLTEIVGLASEAGPIDLVIQSATHSHSAENIALAQVHSLNVQSGNHSHAAENLLLGQTHVLSVANATHAHSAQNLTLTTSGGSLLAQYGGMHRGIFSGFFSGG